MGNQVKLRLRVKSHPQKDIRFKGVSGLPLGCVSDFGRGPADSSHADGGVGCESRTLRDISTRSTATSPYRTERSTTALEAAVRAKPPNCVSRYRDPNSA